MILHTRSNKPSPEIITINRKNNTTDLLCPVNVKTIGNVISSIENGKTKFDISRVLGFGCQELAGLATTVNHGVLVRVMRLSYMKYTTQHFMTIFPCLHQLLRKEISFKSLSFFEAKSRYPQIGRVIFQAGSYLVVFFGFARHYFHQSTTTHVCLFNIKILAFILQYYCDVQIDYLEGFNLTG